MSKMAARQMRKVVADSIDQIENSTATCAAYLPLALNTNEPEIRELFRDLCSRFKARWFDLQADVPPVLHLARSTGDNDLIVLAERFDAAVEASLRVLDQMMQALDIPPSRPLH